MAVNRVGAKAMDAEAAARRAVAVFLDKDGTLIDDLPYNVDPARIRLARGAGAALRALDRAGFKLIVVTNQSGVARGYFPEEALRSVETRLRELLAGLGVPLSGFYYCPHHPEGLIYHYAKACDCRKPGPGLIRRAALDHHIDVEGSWMVGDILNDIEAGRRAGCQTVLLDTGHETEWRLSRERQPHHTVAGLREAAEVILRKGAGDVALAPRRKDARSMGDGL